jgi:hypothetical protein
MIREVAALPSNNKIGALSEKLVRRKTESVVVGDKPVMLHLQKTGCAIEPSYPIVTTEPV